MGRSLPPTLLIRCYSYRFKIELNFKVLKHVIGVFYYHFWSTMWPRIGKNTVNDISSIKDLRSKTIDPADHGCN